MNDILRKIKKCLALSASDNAAEAASALAKAHDLMARHGITQDNVVLSEVQSCISNPTGTRNIPAHMEYLARIVCDVFGCEAIKEVRMVMGEWKNTLRFVGYGSDAEVAAYAYDVLRKKLNRDRCEYIKTLQPRVSRSTKTRKGDVFARAWVGAVKIKVETLKKPLAGDDSLIEKWKHQTYGENLQKPKISIRESRPHDLDAKIKGEEKGHDVNLFAGVTGSFFSVERLASADTP